jgi:phasin family protein
MTSPDKMFSRTLEAIMSTTTPTFEDFQKFSKQQLETVNSLASTVTKGFQEIAAESTDYSKKAFAANSEVVEKLLGAKSVETAIQIQTEYAKSAYEGFVAQTSRINELFVKLATEAFKPVETAFSSVTAK